MLSVCALLFGAMVVYKRSQGIPILRGPILELYLSARDSFLAAYRRVRSPTP